MHGQRYQSSLLLMSIQVNQFEGLASSLFPAGYEVILDASMSVDPDSPDEDNPIAAYLFSKYDGFIHCTCLVLDTRLKCRWFYQ
jgi:hypothetical protein